MNSVHINPADVPHLIAATFPGYRGKKVEVRATEELSIQGLNWSGGSRSQYRACTLEGVATGSADVGNAAAPWANPVEGKAVRIPAGMCIVEHCLFCGSDLGLRIYVNPADMPRYLPAAGSDLSEEEKVVLKLVRSLISSARREEADRYHGINAARYEVLVSILKEKGLLTKQGGLSLSGKNAAAGL